VFTVGFSSVRDIEKFLATQVHVKPIHRFFTPAHAAFTRVEAFSNPGKDDARKVASHRFATHLIMCLLTNQWTPLQKRFKWNPVIERDVRDQIQKTITLLGLPDSEDQLFKRFKAEEFPQSYLKAMQQREREQRRRSKR
jgi:hypothetical protein